MKIAVPSNNPGGMDSGISQHFGHADNFTVIELHDNQVKEVSVIQNPPHAQGGCLAPVSLLAGHGVAKFIAWGMGKRPLMAFQQSGIEVFSARDCETVRQALDAFLAGKLQTFAMDAVCGGGEGHCHD